MSDELILEFGDDGVAHLHEPKPILEIEFQSEDELINWLSDASNKKILPEGVRFAFENIESEDFLERLNSKIEDRE